MSEPGKVVSINGGEIAPPGEARPKIVELAKEMLDRAQSGDLQAIAVVYQHADGCFSYWKEGKRDFAMIGALEVLKHKITADY